MTIFCDVIGCVLQRSLSRATSSCVAVSAECVQLEVEWSRVPSKEEEND